MNDIHVRGNNREKWDQLVFSLEKREKPTLIVIGFDSYLLGKKLYEELVKRFPEYNFFRLDFSAQNIKSLHHALINNLPEKILNSGPVEYVVNVFGLEHSLFSIKDNRFEESSLIKELNFEREILFQAHPFIIIIWTDLYTVNQFKKKAKDLWDWISYAFEFRTQDDKKLSGEIYIPDNKKGKIFISCARDDYKIAQRLYNDLKKAGYDPWLDSKNLLPGRSWRTEIRREIEKSDYFIVLLSKHSVNRKGYARKEVKAALDVLDEYPQGKIFIIPARLDDCRPNHEKLRHIRWADLRNSYEKGLKQILHALDNKIVTADNKIVRAPHDTKKPSGAQKRIKRLKTQYDTIKLDDESRKRVIKGKINIQKLLGREYMAMKNYKKAEQCFRLALALTDRLKGLEHEKEEISFLLSQVSYKPPPESPD